MSIIESAWAVTSYFFIIAGIIVTGICFSNFARPYLLSKKAAVHVGMTYVIVMLLLNFIPLRINNFAAYSIGVLAAFSVMYMEEQRNVEQKIFISITFFSIRCLSFAMANKIDYVLFNEIVLQEKIAERVWLQYGIYVIIRILNIVAVFLLIAGFVYLLNKAFVYKRANMSRRELFMLIMPSVSGMTGYVILRFYQEIYENDTGKDLIGIHGFYGYLGFFHYFISIITILVMTILFQNLKARQEENAGKELLNSQIEDMKMHINEMEKLYNDIRLMRHDMGNHIQTIEHLIDRNEKDEALHYTSRLKREWQEITPNIKSGNPVTDVILLEKNNKAKERNINFQCDFHYPIETNLDAFDISVILNNALDNSLESANGDLPYISITSYCKNSVFMIVICNSFVGNVIIDADTRLPVSTKKDIGHGMGLVNIRRVARMYLGEIVFEQEKDIVTLTVMLQMQ